MQHFSPSHFSTRYRTFEDWLAAYERSAAACRLPPLPASMVSRKRQDFEMGRDPNLVADEDYGLMWAVKRGPWGW